MAATQPFVSQVVPVAPRTYEATALLPGNTQEASTSLDLPYGCSVLGILVTVTRAGFAGGGLVVATDADIMASLELPSSGGQTVIPMGQRGEKMALGGSTAGLADNYVSLPTLDARSRQLNLDIEPGVKNPDPVKISVRWKRDVSGGTKHEDVYVSFAFLCTDRNG